MIFSMLVATLVQNVFVRCVGRIISLYYLITPFHLYQHTFLYWMLCTLIVNNYIIYLCNLFTNFMVPTGSRKVQEFDIGVSREGKCVDFH